MTNTTFQFSKPQLNRLREYVLDDLVSLTELPAYEKLEKSYQDEYLEVHQLAEFLGAITAELPKRLRATKKQAAERLARDQARLEKILAAK